MVCQFQLLPKLCNTLGRTDGHTDFLRSADCCNVQILQYSRGEEAKSKPNTQFTGRLVGQTFCESFLATVRYKPQRKLLKEWAVVIVVVTYDHIVINRLCACRADRVRVGNLRTLV